MYVLPWPIGLTSAGEVPPNGTLVGGGVCAYYYK